MAEICCAVVSEGEAAAGSTAGGACEKISRAARRRRMEIRRFKFVAGVDMPARSPDIGCKRQRIDLSGPIMKVSEMRKDVASSTVESRTDLGSMDGNMLSPSHSMYCDGESRSSLEDFPANLSDDCPSYGLMSVCGRRRDMEDAVSIHPDVHRRGGQNPARYHFFSVFDGHGCSHVAVSCKEKMHEMVAEELDRPGTSPSTCLEWKNIMEKSFSRMDTEAALWRGGPKIPACRCEFQTPKCDHVGSTAVVSVVSRDRIVVANCGDSRAVLCRNGSPIPLSNDHKPDRPDELQRIQDAGGRVIYWDGARVLGVLAMSRAIGDNYLKPFVISEPEVTVTERGEGDEYLILASDGLWDVVTNETACEIVKMCLKDTAPSDCGAKTAGQGSDKACADAAMLLVKLALARQSADNVSVAVVDLRGKFSKPESGK